MVFTTARLESQISHSNDDDDDDNNNNNKDLIIEIAGMWN